VVWLVGVATTISGHAVELILLRVTEAGCMNMVHKLKISKKMNKNEEIESLMIGNVPELVEAARREIVVGEVATVQLNSLLLHNLLYMLQCN
jgi:predicted PP-loop superfamily ATPase